MRINDITKTKTIQAKNSEKYEPTIYYKDIETTPCHLDSQSKHNINHTEEVITGSEQAQLSPNK